MPLEPAALACSIQEACRITGIGRTRLYEAVSSGELPAHKCGRRTILLLSDLEKFLEQLPQMPKKSVSQ
jgi:excisionase family DNA binding protein